MNKSAGIFDILILDYTPMDIRHNENLAKQVTASAIKESMPENYLVSPIYCRALRDEIPEKKYDAVIIAGSILSTVVPSAELDTALGQINELIREIPTFGICFGLHAIAKLTGNYSKMVEEFEIGPKQVILYEDINGVGKAGDIVLLPVNHNCKVAVADGGMKVLAVSNGGIQIADASKHFNNPVIGVQAHPEFAATRRGWRVFRKTYEDTLESVLSGQNYGITLEPMLDAIGDDARNRFLETVNDNPNAVIETSISKRQYDLLMSVFHNTDYRQKLLGKKQSERDYDELRRNSQGLITHFLRKAIEKKKPKQIAKPVTKKIRPNVPKGKQMQLKF